jgi:hypothetical protein
MFLEKSALDQPRVIEYNVFVEEQSSLSVGWHIYKVVNASIDLSYFG